ncbi:MAG: hypothetical protein OEV78_01105 [Spirochaetia bacterium]|nr:hypothetical protein [Spirochaetia bacterium]
MKELITKSPDGNFNLTEDGEQELYFITTRRLILYYLKEVLKQNDISIAETNNSLKSFITQNFKKVEDYLKKLPDLARFINESNIEKFQKFMGQYFITTLQKEKQALINKEIEKSKEILDNPFWAPSNQMLKIYAQDFLKSPPLEMDGEAKPDEIIKINSVKENKKEIFVASTLEGAPGFIFLQSSLSNSFINAKPLDFKSFEFNEINNFDDEQNDSQENDNAINIATLKTNENILQDPPGEKLLRDLQIHFNKCPPLELSHEHFIDESKDKIPVDKHIITLKSFAGILSNIAKFTKNKDNAGYQNWYNNLNSNLKGALKINSLINSEKKGESVNWGQEIMMFAASTNINKDELYQLTEEVKLYSKILNFIRHRLTNDPKIKLNKNEASNIYTQSINILSGNESFAEKKSALTILLFQITDQTMREIILKDYEKILVTLYK